MNCIHRDYFHNTQNNLHNAHNYVLFQNDQFHPLYADSVQDCCKYFQIETVDVDLSSTICICIIFIILNSRNCWIDFNDVGFDTAYPFFWFWVAQIKLFFLSKSVSFRLGFFFVVADRCREIPLRWWSNPIFISESVFLLSDVRPMFWLFLH